MGAKLVRGAYMEKEAAYAAKKNLLNPIHSSKAGTDADFNRAWKYCLENLQHVHFCAGSHNETSNLELAKEMDAMSISHRRSKRIWFAQLYGMSDNISYALAKEGFNVAKYVPYGPVFSVMPYLVKKSIRKHIGCRTDEPGTGPDPVRTGKKKTPVKRLSRVEFR